MSRLLRERHDEVLVHTGQHYDDELSRVFFDELGVPAPDRQLGAGGGSNTEQTARILGLLEGVIADERPDLVMVYGDTNSTLAAALAAAQARVPVAHVEAGMRSFDRAMPEELNRVLCDHASDLLLCSTADGHRQPGARARAGGPPPGRRRHGRRVADVRPDSAGALAVLWPTTGWSPGSTCWPLRTGPATWTTPRAWSAWWRCWRPCPGAASCRCTRAPPPGCRSSAFAGAWTTPRGCGCCRRWATWTSCAWPWTRRPCSPIRAACRRRPTCWACAA